MKAQNMAMRRTFPPAASMHFCGQVSSMSAVRLGVVVWSPIPREQRQAEKFVSYHVFALQEKRFVGPENLFSRAACIFVGKCPA